MIDHLARDRRRCGRARRSLRYELRGRGPVLALHAAPMDAARSHPSQSCSPTRTRWSPGILAASTAASLRTPTVTSPRTSAPTTSLRC